MASVGEGGDQAGAGVGVLLPAAVMAPPESGTVSFEWFHEVVRSKCGDGGRMVRSLH